MATIKWRYCWELEEINEAIKKQDPEWTGLTSARQIISVSFEPRHGAYLVVWLNVD